MVYSSANTIWVLLGAVLVMFMQPGFAMVEAGFTRAKNAGNIVMKNIMDYAFGSIAYWLVGFSIMFGTSVAGAGILGTPDLALTGDTLDGAAPDGVTPWSFFIFQTVFCATAATIVSGAMAERTKFSAYCVYSIVISALVYPIEAHWAWGGGWLNNVGAGFHDFAGSTIVHMTGGVAALVGAAMLGPRIGKYSKTGKSRAILGHNIPIGALGVFILWFGWFGFNGASTVAAGDDDSLIAMGHIFVTTNLSAAAGGVTVLLLTWLLYKSPDVSLTLNGVLAGLVGITAGCDAVNQVGAIIIGIISGLVVVGFIQFLDKKLHIDDPVGAVAVHGAAGAVGTILVGFLAQDGGLLFGGGASLLLAQVVGVLAIGVFVGIAMFITFFLIKKTIGLRVSAEEEIQGLDVSEHGLPSAYADFVYSVQSVGATGTDSVPTEAIPAPGSVPPKAPSVTVTDTRRPASVRDPNAPKFTWVSIITRPSGFEALDAAMQEIGITGMTVSNIMGYGMQKGHDKEYYRGVQIEPHLLPKIRVEIVVSKIPVETVVEAAKKALYTGNFGDGKIFVSDVENVVKIRTGEEGYDALQDE
ncbi:MAG: ammonium transporter [Clostridiales Family XIII bacterium]|jgi:Amt family ammonium transporter|nr:ammonium transporter [Clostridiales Family XIII bacterium]